MFVVRSPLQWYLRIWFSGCLEERWRYKTTQKGSIRRWTWKWMKFKDDRKYATWWNLDLPWDCCRHAVFNYIYGYANLRGKQKKEERLHDKRNSFVSRPSKDVPPSGRARNLLPVQSIWPTSNNRHHEGKTQEHLQSSKTNVHDKPCFHVRLLLSGFLSLSSPPS